jgi:hypothetical protein
MGEVRQLAPEERITFQQAAERYIHHVEHVMVRKSSTVKDYRIITTKHLGPHFHTKTLEKITPDDVVAYIAAKRHAGLAVKTITNHLNSGWVSQPRQVRARIVSRGANSSPRPQASVGSWRSLVETRAYHAERDGLTPSSTPVSALPLKCNSNATLASFRAENTHGHDRSRRARTGYEVVQAIDGAGKATASTGLRQAQQALRNSPSVGSSPQSETTVDRIPPF